MPHEITRVRHELRRRSLRVKRREEVSPNMLRLWLEGDALAGFTSLGADDHVKIFVPGSATGSETERRDYTPRRYDAAAGELAIDFALHDAGPATQWARSAQPGDPIEIGGPRGSMIVPADFDWYLLVGDETALPAIGRRLEELPAGKPVITVVAVTAPDEQQELVTSSAHRAVWVHRPAAEADDAGSLLAAVSELEWPAGEGFVWIAAEAKVARALRTHAVEERGHPVAWLKASGYWVKGRADATEKFED